MDSKFFAYIVSNGSKEYYPENTLSKFSVKFPFSLNIPIDRNEKWGICINSIGLSSKFESNYSKYKYEPLIIQMINTNDQLLCDVQSETPLHQMICQTKNFVKDAMLSNQFNKCYVNNLKFTCDLEYIKKFLIYWASENLYHGFYNEQKNTFTKSIQQFNYYFNNLGNQEDLEILIDNLKESDLKLTKLKENKYKIEGVYFEFRQDGAYFDLKQKNELISEKILFLRQDLIARCDITQETDFVNESEDINTLSARNPLFQNLINARELNNTYLRIGSHNYKLLVINKEYKAIIIEFKKFMDGFLTIPNMIKIQCENIRSQVFNNTHSNDIEIIKPNFDLKGSHYFQEFKKPLFVPLLNSDLSNLTFTLTNEYDEQLRLSTGLPTILSVTFKKMTSDYKSFNITVTPTFNIQGNTISQFRTVLPQTFNFNEKWSVGLKSITIPNHFKLLPSDDNDIVIFKLTDDMKIIPNEKYKIQIPNIRANPGDFIEYLNSKILPADAFNFIKSDTNEISIKARKNISIFISKNLAQVLGLISLTVEELLESGKKYFWKAMYKANTTTPLNKTLNLSIFRPAFLMVYLDFVELTLVSSKYTNIVKIVPVKFDSESDECQTTAFETIEYRKIAKSLLSEFKTEIRDPAGNLVQFDNDMLSLHLYFTNNQYNNEV